MPRTYRSVERDAELRADLAGVPVEVILPAVQKEIDESPIQIGYGATNRNDLADIDVIDSSVRITFNLRHPFVRNVMVGPETSPNQRAALEILMCTVLGVHRDLEGTMTPEVLRFYHELTHTVSDQLAIAIDLLWPVDPKTGMNELDEIQAWIDEDEEGGLA